MSDELPAVAEARMAEIRRSGTWGSALTSDEFAAIRSVGFEPVGQVLGACVYNIGYTGGYNCPGAWGSWGYVPARTTTQVSGRGGYGSFGPLVQAMYEARHKALDRMTAECEELGGHGVVGVRLTIGAFPAGGLEFKAIGTAIRAPGVPPVSAWASRGGRPKRPFTSDLSGQDFAKLIMKGWVPAGLALGISIGSRHDDWLTVGQTRWGAGNAEVVGYTELVNDARHDARHAAGTRRHAARRRGRGDRRHGDARAGTRVPGAGGPPRPYRGGHHHRHRDRQVQRRGAAAQRTDAGRHVARPPAPPGRQDPDLGETMTDQGNIATELDAAGVPQDAMRRLAELQPGRPGSIFTSDLSVNEFLLVREAGFRPLGLVLGSSIYHVGLQIGRWGRNQELDVLSQAMYHARELAMSRMEAEADALRADGIVGVRLDVEMKEFGADIAEFIAVGTAVKAEEGAGGGGVDNWRNNKNQPFTSDLSGQDFWTLIRAGYAPLGMVMGSCVYHVAHQRMGAKMGNIGKNVEIEQFTQALYDARELAMSRMQAEAEALHAEGIVGVQLRQHSHTWGSHTTEFFAIGTAVRPLRPDHIIERPTMVLTLDA